MGFLKSVDMDALIAAGAVEEADVTAMRRAYYEDGYISEAEAEVLFRLEHACSRHDLSWAAFFVEAVTDFVVNQAQPEGYVTAENASWLVSQIEQGAKGCSKNELELLINVLDRARWSPQSLASFALEQVRRSIVNGKGPMRQGDQPPGVVSETDVETLRRILYAFAGDGGIAITRAEAEVLIAIEESLAEGAAPPAWTDLFVKAMANVIMSASGYAAPTREEALRADAWLKRRGELSPGAFLTAMVTSSLSNIWDYYHTQSPEERALERLEQQRIEIITNEEITPSEATWLVDRLTRDSRLTETELVLLDWLRREQPMLHPALVELVERAGAAA